MDLFSWTGNPSHQGSFLSDNSCSPLIASSSKKKKKASSSLFSSSGVTFFFCVGNSLHPVKDWAKLYLQEFWKDIMLFLVHIARPSLPTYLLPTAARFIFPKDTLWTSSFYHGNLWRFQSKDQALESGIQGPPNGFPSDFYQTFKKEILPFLPNLLAENWKERIFPNSFQETLIP